MKKDPVVLKMQYELLAFVKDVTVLLTTLDRYAWRDMLEVIQKKLITLKRKRFFDQFPD